MNEISFEKFIVSSTLASLLCFILLLTFVITTESTFGQRCSSMGHEGNEFEKCVEHFSKGL